MHDAELEGGSGRSSRRLRLFCEVHRAGEFGFNVAYRDGPVFWGPDYVVRIDTANQKLSIEYAAEITQATGDVWRKVSLSILPHRQGKGGVLPRLDPWRLTLSEDYERWPDQPDMQDAYFGFTDVETVILSGFAEPEEVSLHHADFAKDFRRNLVPGGTHGSRDLSRA